MDAYKLLSAIPLPQSGLKGLIEQDMEAENIRTCEPMVKLYEDLALETLRLTLTDEFRLRIFKIACKSAGSATALARLVKVAGSTICRYRDGSRAIPYLFLQRLSNFLETQISYECLDDIKKHVNGFKLGTKGNSTVTIKIKEGVEELNFENADGARIVAAILGDGYLGNNVASYINLDATLRAKVNESIRKVVGNVPVNIYRGKEVRYPQALAIILKKIGLPPGPKVYTDPSVPTWIKESSDMNVVRIFLRQFFSDEADVSESKGTINLPQSVDITTLPEQVKEKLRAKIREKGYERYAPRRLLDVKEMLRAKFGIRAGGPYPVRYYKATRRGLEGERLKWRLSISGKADLEKFEREIGFDIDYKQKALQRFLNKIKIYQAKSGFGLSNALQAAAKMENVQGEITSFAVAKEMKRGVAISQKWLRRLVEQGLIVKIGGGENRGRVFGRSPVRYRLTDKGLLEVQNSIPHQNLDVGFGENKKDVIRCPQNS